MKLIYRIVLGCLLFTSAAWAQQAEVSASYLYQGSNQAPGGGDWFAASGGRADVSFGNWRHFAGVAEFAGTHTVGLNWPRQNLFTYMAGPRRVIHLGSTKGHEAWGFAQFLLGGVHGSDGLYPEGGAIKNSANAFAFSAGGGVELNLNRRISLRLIQADYLYTHLPDHYNNFESSFRLGAGIAFHLH